MIHMIGRFLPFLCRIGNTLLILAIAMIFFASPAIGIAGGLVDNSLSEPGIPSLAKAIFNQLTPKYEQWALKRIASAQASKLDASNISGTEWPIFGSVFYLWAVENMQADWDASPNAAASEVAPKLKAKGAIEAAAALVLDENHAAWVKQHWGDDYMRKENVFYRALRIAAMVSYSNLTGDKKHESALRVESDSLAKEIDRSLYGLREDYPGECYPGDVLLALLCIKRADNLLGADHSALIERAKRGFSGTLLDRHGLVPYSADASHGVVTGDSRGCGNSYVSFLSPFLWPEEAARWYSLYEANFWQTKLGAAGFREFAKDVPNSEWYLDVDSGPVIEGYGLAASAFGLGAARANGRFDHARPLALETLATSWPLYDGTLLLPRFLSDATDAPFLGEAAILYNLTVQPASGIKVVRGGAVPHFVYYVLLAYGVVIFAAIWYGRQRKGIWVARWPWLQFGMWLGLLGGGIGCFANGYWPVGSIFILLMLLLPRELRLVEKSGQ